MNEQIKRRWLSIGATGAVFALVLGVLALQRRGGPVAGGEGGVSAAEQAKRELALWGGNEQRNLVNLDERNMPTEWDTTADKEKNILWSAALGSKAYGGPIVAGGKIFMGTNNNRPRDKEVRGDKGVLMCFRESDGDFLWQIAHDKLEAGRVNDWPEEGICSGAAVRGDRLYYVSNRCEVVCATTAGKVDWKLDMIGKLGVFPHNLATCSPLLVGDVLYVITSNGVDEGHINIPAPNAPSFLALDVKDKGKVLWQDKSPGRNIMHGQWSNPVYAVVKGKKQVIFPGGDGYLYSFDPVKGELLWKFNCNPRGAKYRLGAGGTKNDFVSTPVIHDGKLYIAVGQDPEHKKGVGHLWCVDVTKEPKNKDKDLSPVTPEKDEAPNKIDPKNSALVWHYGGKNPDDEEGREYLFGRSLSTCAVDKGLCYACDFDGFFFCFDAATGKKHWEHELGANTWSSPYVVDGKVYIGNENGAIHIFEHSAKKKLIKKVQMRGRVRVTPTAANGVLYVVTENPCRLWAIKSK